MKKTELYGLVVCGGESSRMGMDKSLLVYHRKPQRYHVYEMLIPFCEKVFISCNQIQAETILPEYEKMTDDEEFRYIGPMASLLTALRNFPERDFLVIGCDYPFLETEDIVQLLTEHEKKRQVTVYQNPETTFIEPLLGIYTAECMPMLFNQFQKHQYALKNFLSLDIVNKITPGSIQHIRSIDTPDNYREAQSIIHEISKL